MIMFNVWTIILQSLNIKEWKFSELQIAWTRNHLSISIEKMSKGKTPQKWKKKTTCNVHKTGRSHVQCLINQYAKFEYKSINTVGSYRLHKLGIPEAF